MTPEPKIGLTRAALLMYGALAFPLAFAGIPIYLHAPDFYASELGVPLTTLGATLLLLRIIDAVQDPWIGRTSDLFSRWRRQIMALGIAMLGGGFWMIFHPIATWPLIWFALGVFICTTGFSIVSINFQALGGLWHATQNERTSITAWREGLGLVGLLAAAIAPTLLGSLVDAPAAFHTLSVIYIPILALTSWLFLRWMEKATIDAPALAVKPVAMLSLLKSAWIRHFFGITFLNGFASAVPAVLVIFYIRDWLQAEADTGLFLLLYFLSGALAMPLWQRVSRSVGKYRCWIFSITLAIATFSWAALLGPGDREAYAAICILSGIALGADLSLPPSMMADYIAHRGDQASASSHFSILTFLSKASLALATGLMLPLLGLLGYQPGSLGGDGVTATLGLSYALVPCLVKMVVVFWLWRKLPLLQTLGENTIPRKVITA